MNPKQRLRSWQRQGIKQVPVQTVECPYHCGLLHRSYLPIEIISGIKKVSI